MSEVPDGETEWITSATAADILGVSRNRVLQLVARGFLPGIQADGIHYFRRHQVEVIANARDARKLRGTLGRE